MKANKNQLLIRYLFSCGLVIFSTSFFSYSVGNEKRYISPENINKEGEKEIDQLNSLTIEQKNFLNSGLQLEIEENKKGFFVIGKNNKKYYYIFNNTEYTRAALDNINYYSSDKSGRWHCIKVPYWKFDSRAKNIEPLKKFVTIKINTSLNSEKRVEREVPCIQLGNKLIRAQEKFYYVLFNLEEDISVKTNTVELDQEGFLIIDSFKIFSKLVEFENIYFNFSEQDNKILESNDTELDVQEYCEEDHLQIQEDSTGTGFFLADNKNRSIHYSYKNEEYVSVIPDKICHHSSTKNGRWHCIKIPCWSLLPYINLENLQEKPDIIMIKMDFSNQENKLTEPIERQVPCIEKEGDLLMADEILKYVVFNLEENLKLKIDSPNLDKDNHLIIDSSIMVPDFDEGVPEGWKVEIQPLKNADNNLLIGKNGQTFYTRKAQFKEKKPILSLHMVTPQGTQWINLGDQINRSFSHNKNPGEKKFMIDYLTKEIMKNKGDLSEESNLNLTSDFCYEYRIKCDDIQSKCSTNLLFTFYPTWIITAKNNPKIIEFITNQMKRPYSYSTSTNFSFKELKLIPVDDLNWKVQELIYEYYISDKERLYNISFYLYINLKKKKIIMSLSHPSNYNFFEIGKGYNTFDKNKFLENNKENEINIDKF